MEVGGEINNNVEGFTLPPGRFGWMHVPVPSPGFVRIVNEFAAAPAHSEESDWATIDCNDDENYCNGHSITLESGAAPYFNGSPRGDLTKFGSIMGEDAIAIDNCNSNFQLESSDIENDIKLIAEGMDANLSFEKNGSSETAVVKCADEDGAAGVATKVADTSAPDDMEVDGAEGEDMNWKNLNEKTHAADAEVSSPTSTIAKLEENWELHLHRLF